MQTASKILLLLGVACSPAYAAVYNFTALAVPNAGVSSAQDVNNLGHIVGIVEFANGDSDFHGYVYKEGTFSILDYPGAAETLPIGMNDAGEIVGAFNSQNSGSESGFLFSDGTFTRLDVPGARETRATDINNNGDIGGIYRGQNNYQQGFVLSNGIYMKTEIPGAIATGVTHINDAGIALGWLYDGLSLRSFTFDGASYTTFEQPNTGQSVPEGINDNGDIVGWFIHGSGRGQHGFIRRSGTYETFDFPGATHTSLSGLNNAGIIVGNFNQTDGSPSQAFMAVPIPLPPTFYLFGTAPGALIRFQSRPNGRLNAAVKREARSRAALPQFVEPGLTALLPSFSRSAAVAAASTRSSSLTLVPLNTTP